jgi:asparagine synthase (glutamine-hydrolysing)
LGIDPSYDSYWHFRAFYRTDLPVLTRLQYLDFHTLLPDDLLTKVDRASMAVGLEVRVPFLAKGVIDFAFSLPEPVRFLGGRLKGLLKYAYRDRLPAEILERPKKGFSIPTRAWSDGLLGGGSSQETILRSLFPRELDAAMNRGRVAEPVVGGR